MLKIMYLCICVTAEIFSGYAFTCRGAADSQYYGELALKAIFSPPPTQATVWGAGGSLWLGEAGLNTTLTSPSCLCITGNGKEVWGAYNHNIHQ